MYKNILKNINTQLSQISLGIDAINDDNFEESLKNVNLLLLSANNKNITRYEYSRRFEVHKRP